MKNLNRKWLVEEIGPWGVPNDFWYECNPGLQITEINNVIERSEFKDGFWLRFTYLSQEVTTPLSNRFDEWNW